MKRKWKKLVKKFSRKKLTKKNFKNQKKLHTFANGQTRIIAHSFFKCETRLKEINSCAKHT